MWTFIIIYLLVTVATNAYDPPVQANVFKIMGYFKLLISFVKYMP